MRETLGLLEGFLSRGCCLMKPTLKSLGLVLREEHGLMVNP